MKKRMHKMTACVLGLCLLLIGCQHTGADEENKYLIYYLNTEGIGLVTEPYGTED